MNAELNYHLYRDVRDYLKELDSHSRYSAMPNETHYTLLHLRKKYGEDVVQVEINKQTQENK